MKYIHVLGGGTFSHVRNHLALAAPAFGTTAKELTKMLEEKRDYMKYQVLLDLTKMADPRTSELVTNDDVEALIDRDIKDPDMRCIIFNVAMCDFEGSSMGIESGKYAKRLPSSVGHMTLDLTAAVKVIGKIRKVRKDIFVVGFKTTTGATPQEQFFAGLKLLKDSSINLVLANDTVTRHNMIIVPEESSYSHTTDRHLALTRLVQMTLARLDSHYTRSTVIEGPSVAWNGANIPESLRTVVNHCIQKGAYKPFQDKTTGHFAHKYKSGYIATSIRKSNFNELDKTGMVMIETKGSDEVLAYGAKPSVGGQSQRIVFNQHPEMNCIVHFHAPLKENNWMRTVAQWPYECGSHECGQNTSTNLRDVVGDGSIKAVFLEKHGPNIVFNSKIDPQKVINFIDDNFDLKGNTYGLPEVKQQRSEERVNMLD